MTRRQTAESLVNSPGLGSLGPVLQEESWGSLQHDLKPTSHGSRQLETGRDSGRLAGGWGVPHWDIRGGRVAYQTLKGTEWYLQNESSSGAYTLVTPGFFSFIYCSTRDRTQGLSQARQVLDPLS